MGWGLLGFGGGLLIMMAVSWFFQNHSPSIVRKHFGRLQILSAAFMAFSHGSNDGQKFIGVFTLALVIGGIIPEFHVSLPVILICGTGHRSSLGCSILKQHGFKDVYNAAGGMTAYSASGFSPECPMCVGPHGPAFLG